MVCICRLNAIHACLNRCHMPCFYITYTNNKVAVKTCQDLSERTLFSDSALIKHLNDCTHARSAIALDTSFILMIAIRRETY